MSRPRRRIPESPVPLSVEDWFVSRGWSPFGFQREAWAAYRANESGLIHASTGAGKTYAAFLGPVLEALQEPPASAPPVRVLWVTPLRALSGDTALSLASPLPSVGLNWDVGTRTGDTSSTIRARQKKRLPTVLVTTPESLSLLLTYPNASEKFANLQCVVCDEWHELLGSKRGVLLELALARLRSFVPTLRTWGLSATLGNLATALSVLLGPNRQGRILQGHLDKAIEIDAILPARIERFPWAGHLGLGLLPEVVRSLEEVRSGLVFTNTRSQAELWYQALLEARPQWAGQMALHHGSLDRKARDWVENQLRIGSLRCVVCTSTLDLGVDFAPVDRVFQVGSPKGVARLLQRAGRSGHQPGARSRVTCVPTNAFELIEVSAARTAAGSGALESREPLRKPLDVLAQHLVSSALAGGFCPETLKAEVRTTHAFADLTETEWDWVLDFATRGGESLRAYPDFRRVEFHEDLYRVPDEKLARRHRMAVGTIASDAAVEVRFLRGGRLGTLEESFAARLKAGDRFTFAGRSLEFIRLYQMTVWVRISRKPATSVPRWMGGRLPLSGELAKAVRDTLDQARRGLFPDEELKAVKPVLEVQARCSTIPGSEELLVEQFTTRDGHHFVLYPFEGRLVHEGMAALLAYRLSRLAPQTFTLAANDYGFELGSPDPITIDAEALRTLLSPTNMTEDVLGSMNAGELTKRQFREIARVAGLVNSGLPREGRSAKQIQASSGLFYEVFREYDPENLLLRQARQEVLDQQFELRRLQGALKRISRSQIVMIDAQRPTPFAFPLIVDRLRDSMSSEKLADRVRRMAADLERKSGVV